MGLFSPNTLKASFSAFGEPARACHYACIITPPLGIIAGGGALGVLGSALGIAGAAQVSLMAESVSIPGKQIATTPFTMYGTTMKMPYGTVFDDLNISFICTKSMVERLFFDTWHTFIHNPHNNYMHYFNEYVGTIIIKKLNDASGPALVEGLNLFATWIVQDAYPVTVEAQEMSYGSEDYLRLNVQFAYRKWMCVADEVTSSMLPTPTGGSPGTPTGLGAPIPTEEL